MTIFGSFKKLFQRRQEIRMPRRWPRILMTESTHITMQDGRREPVRLANLSAGGARVQTPFALSAHDRLMLHLDLGAGARRQFDAEVVYCRRDSQGLHYVGGVHFVQAGRDGILEIAAFLEDEMRRRRGSGETWRG